VNKLDRSFISYVNGALIDAIVIVIIAVDLRSLSYLNNPDGDAGLNAKQGLEGRCFDKSISSCLTRMPHFAPNFDTTRVGRFMN
jgi:hypothetical protein